MPLISISISISSGRAGLPPAGPAGPAGTLRHVARPLERSCRSSPGRTGRTGRTARSDLAPNPASMSLARAPAALPMAGKQPLDQPRGRVAIVRRRLAPARPRGREWRRGGASSASARCGRARASEDAAQRAGARVPASRRRGVYHSSRLSPRAPWPPRVSTPPKRRSPCACPPTCAAAKLGCGCYDLAISRKSIELSVV